jgi:hypothetical protein
MSLGLIGTPEWKNCTPDMLSKPLIRKWLIRQEIYQ